MIPLARPHFDDRELEAVRRVLESGWVVQGPEVAAFESELRAMHPVDHAVAVTSGTAALHVLFLALDIRHGDVVFVPSFAWPSAANACRLLGALPVFVDVDPVTYNMDPMRLEEAITEAERGAWGRPRAIVAVHEFGLPVDVEAIQEIAERHELFLIEDAACALGASHRGRPVGTFGKAGILSFHPRKAATTGEGGAVLTNDVGIADACRRLRDHGQVIEGGERDFVTPGLNYRLTDIQAAIGRVQLAKFPKELDRRREHAVAYDRALSDDPDLTRPALSDEHTWQTYMVVLGDGIDRDSVAAALAERKIGAGPGSVAGHLGRAYRGEKGAEGARLRVSERLHRQGLALPMFGAMTAEDISAVSVALRETLMAVPRREVDVHEDP